MSEEEIIKRINYVIDKWYDENLEIDCRWIQGLLDLYNKEKEKNKSVVYNYECVVDKLEELEQIEKEHKKENGELREKVKEIEKQRNDIVWRLSNLTEKIENKIEELEKFTDGYNEEGESEPNLFVIEKIELLQELLGEE